MKQILLILKKKSIYIILLLICLFLSSCHSVASDAKEVCDCYSDTSIENKGECEKLYQDYSKKYQLDLSDSMKFQQKTLGCVTSGALGQMSKALSEASKELGNINADGSISTTNSGLEKVNETINNLNNEVQQVKSSFYFYSFLLVLVGIALAIYGLKRFKISLALAFVIPTIILLQMLDWLSMGWFIAIITIGVLIFILSKPLTYFTAWFFICVFVLIPFFLIFKDADVRTIITKVIMAVSIGITYLARKHIKATVIGISSGYSVGIGLASIISAQLFVNGEILNAFLLPGLIMFTGIVCGLAYQFQYALKEETTSDTNTYNPEVLNNQNSNKISFINFKKYSKIYLIILVSCLLLGGGFFAYKITAAPDESSVEEVIPTTSLWDIIIQYKENNHEALNKLRGKKYKMTGWLNTKDLSPEGDVLIELRGTTNKNGQYYLMSAGQADKPANEYTGYNGIANCKLVGDTETLKKFDKEKGYLQEVTIEGTINNIEESSNTINLFGQYLTIKSYVVSLSNGKVINVKNLTKSKSKVQETQPEQTTEQTQTKIETPDFSSSIGEWRGAFGNDQILLSIESINDNGSVTGYNIVKNNRRNLTGFARDNEFELNEPGDEKWDGVFKFSIAEGILKGTWVSINGKSRREFSLSK